jgi:hypothetical protein
MPPAAARARPIQILHPMQNFAIRDNVTGSNTAEQAALVALLNSSTHYRAPLTHTSHHRPTLVTNVGRFRASPILTNSRFRRFCACVSLSCVSGCLCGRSSTKCSRGGEARGHSSASFDLQRSNKGLFEPQQPCGHDRVPLAQNGKIST